MTGEDFIRLDSNSMETYNITDCSFVGNDAGNNLIYIRGGQAISFQSLLFDSNIAGRAIMEIEASLSTFQPMVTIKTVDATENTVLDSIISIRSTNGMVRIEDLEVLRNILSER